MVIVIYGDLVLFCDGLEEKVDENKIKNNTNIYSSEGTI